jgi:hypothetical protein
MPQKIFSFSPTSPLLRHLRHPQASINLNMARAHAPNLDEILLENHIETLRNDRPVASYKLNLLRSNTTSSVLHMARFNELEDQLLDLARQISQLDDEVRRRKYSVEIEDLAADDDQIRTELKSSMALLSKLDMVGDDIIALKLGLEQKAGLIAITPAVEVNGQPATSTVSSAPVDAKRRKPIPKPRTILSPESGGVVKIKKEEKPPKKVVVKPFMPEGYYFVQAVCSPYSISIL